MYAFERPVSEFDQGFGCVVTPVKAFIPQALCGQYINWTV